MQHIRRALCLAGWLFCLGTPVTAQEGTDWHVRADGRAFAQYMRSGTQRGAHAFGSANWLMLELGRTSGQNRFMTALMLSAEPITLGECGYPRLLTPGFLCFENALQDRQHAHPLIMGLAASYERALSDQTTAHLQAALVGEPAFGPAPYFHRASARFDPIAPLTNDILNPAHTAYGVVTAGVVSGRLGWQASVFNGGARDHNPYDFDIAPLHSYATRGTLWLGEGSRVQASFADFQPSGSTMSHHGAGDGRMRAWSASLEHQTGDAVRNGALTLAWAAHHADGQTVHSGLLEGQLTRRRHTWFGRYEQVERVEMETMLHEHPDGSHESTDMLRRFWVGELSVGYVHRLARWFGLDASAGARASMSSIPAYIYPRYQSDVGYAFALFAMFVPAPRTHRH